MNESQYTRSVNSRLPSDVYSFKLNCRFVPGVPDCWHSGFARDLWIEWKYKHAMPKKHKPNCSQKQLEWLNNRYDEGRRVLVLVGSPTGIAVYEDKQWNEQCPTGIIYSRNEIVAWLTNYLRGHDDKVISK